MTTTPCSDPANDPNDWFIDRHGKQYGDDPWLSKEEIEKLEAAMAEEGLTRLQQIAGVARAEAKVKRDALIRRRRAKEDCYACPIRLACLSGAIDRRETKGTWGGLFEEEIDKTIRMKRRRERKNTRATEEQSRQVA